MEDAHSFEKSPNSLNEVREKTADRRRNERIVRQIAWEATHSRLISLNPVGGWSKAIADGRPLKLVPRWGGSNGRNREFVVPVEFVNDRAIFDFSGCPDQLHPTELLLGDFDFPQFEPVSRKFSVGSMRQSESDTASRQERGFALAADGDDAELTFHDDVVFVRGIRISGHAGNSAPAIVELETNGMVHLAQPIKLKDDGCGSLSGRARIVWPMNDGAGEDTSSFEAMVRVRPVTIDDIGCFPAAARSARNRGKSVQVVDVITTLDFAIVQTNCQVALFPHGRFKLTIPSASLRDQKLVGRAVPDFRRMEVPEAGGPFDVGESAATVPELQFANAEDALAAHLKTPRDEHLLEAARPLLFDELFKYGISKKAGQQLAEEAAVFTISQIAIGKLAESNEQETVRSPIAWCLKTTNNYMAACRRQYDNKRTQEALETTRRKRCERRHHKPGKPLNPRLLAKLLEKDADVLRDEANRSFTRNRDRALRARLRKARQAYLFARVTIALEKKGHLSGEEADVSMRILVRREKVSVAQRAAGVTTEFRKKAIAKVILEAAIRRLMGKRGSQGFCDDDAEIIRRHVFQKEDQTSLQRRFRFPPNEWHRHWLRMHERLAAAAKKLGVGKKATEDTLALLPGPDRTSTAPAMPSNRCSRPR